MPSGTRRLEPLSQQELHAVLWSTYLRPRVGIANGLPPLTAVLAGLDAVWRAAEPESTKKHLPAVGTALWSLLPAYEKKRPPRELSKLLLDVLMLEIDEARNLLKEPAHGVFPPLRSPLIRVSTFRRWNDATTPGLAHAELEACVAGDFDDLVQRIVDPEHWPIICPIFWLSMERRGSGWAGRLRSPGGGQIDAIDVQLGRHRVTSDALRLEAELRLVPKQNPSAGAQLKFAMYPEPASPGWTRILHKRQVAFGTGVPAEYRSATLDYWTKSELACLALN